MTKSLKNKYFLKVRLFFLTFPPELLWICECLVSARVQVAVGDDGCEGVAQEEDGPAAQPGQVAAVVGGLEENLKREKIVVVFSGKLKSGSQMVYYCLRCRRNSGFVAGKRILNNKK